MLDGLDASFPDSTEGWRTRWDKVKVDSVVRTVSCNCVLVSLRQKQLPQILQLLVRPDEVRPVVAVNVCGKSSPSTESAQTGDEGICCEVRDKIQMDRFCCQTNVHHDVRLDDRVPMVS
uniref:(northern house mosquito) hypothetical protein n=1 Tax=Culex pipiens TaxID=7175 RepID=A0A8D8I2X2_CULPI